MTREEVEKIVVDHLPLVQLLARNMKLRLPRHVEYDDVQSSAVLGLLDAVYKYDPTRGCSFRVYAKHRIRGAILDEFRKLDWVPRSVRLHQRRLERAIRESEQVLGRPAEDSEVAARMDLDLDAFHELEVLARHVSLVSLDEIRRDDDSTYEELLADAESENPFAAFTRTEMKGKIAAALRGLPDKERIAVILYFWEEMTQSEIAPVLGVTDSRICQLVGRGVLRLQRLLRTCGEAL